MNLLTHLQKKTLWRVSLSGCANQGKDMFKRKDPDKYDDFAMKCPLLLDEKQERELLDYMNIVLEQGDEWVEERNTMWDEHKIKVRFGEQQKQVKHIRKELECVPGKNGSGIPAQYLYAECVNVQNRFKVFFKNLKKCEQQKAEGKKRINWPEKPKSRAEKLKRIPRWKRSINMRAKTTLKSVLKSMRRSEANPLLVEFYLPGLDKTVYYRNKRDIPANAELTEMTVSYKNGKWWVSFNWRTLKGEPENLILTATEDVPDFTGKSNQEIVDMLDQSREKFKGGDIGCNNYMTLSDGSAPDRFNLSEEHAVRKEELRAKKKHYQTKQNRKRNENGDEAYKGENYKKNVIKQQDVCQHMTDIDVNQRYQMIAVLESECHILVLEDLNNKGMRENGRISRDTKRRMAETGFGEIKRIAREKFGDRLILVNPAYTSRTCSCCGHEEKKNRSGEKFRCRQCGFTEHADRNAAINILAAGVVAFPEKFRYR